MTFKIFAIAMGLLSLVPHLALSQVGVTPPTEISTFYHSTSGLFFSVRPAFLDEIRALIAQVRNEMSRAKAKGQLVCYLSVPVSPLGGSYFPINSEIAAATRLAVSDRFGPSLMVIDPAAYNLGDIAGTRASSGEYMSVWSDVLAGTDGTGADIDMIYFAGPSDVARFFGLTGKNNIGELESWMGKRAESDKDFAQYVADTTKRSAFIRYYVLRGSAAYSKGAHDEWNVAVAINAKRGVGNEIAIYFNGEPIAPADYDARTSAGNQVLGY